MVATVTDVFEKAVHNVIKGETADNDSVFLQAGDISRGSAAISSLTR
jgi:hypothetical protein